MFKPVSVRIEGYSGGLIHTARVGRVHGRRACVALSNTRRREHLERVWLCRSAGAGGRDDAQKAGGWAIWSECCVDWGLGVGVDGRDVVVTSRQCDEVVGIWKARGRNANAWEGCAWDSWGQLRSAGAPRKARNLATVSLCLRAPCWRSLEDGVAHLCVMMQLVGMWITQL